MKMLIPQFLLIGLIFVGCGRRNDERTQVSDTPVPHDKEKHGVSTRESKAPHVPPTRAAKETKGIFTVTNAFDFGRRQVSDFVFCPKRRRLYVSFWDRRDLAVYEWDVDRGKVVHKYHLLYGCGGIAVSPDGRHLVVNDGDKAVIIETAGKRKMLRLDFKGRAYRLEFSADGPVIWTLDGVILFDLSGKPVPNFAYKKPEVENGSPWRLICSKASARTYGLYYRDADGKDHRLTNNEWDDNYCITRDGQFVAAMTLDGEIVVWRTSDCKELFRRKIASRGVYLAYDADKNCVLLGDREQDGTTFLRTLSFDDRTDTPKTRPGVSSPSSR